MAPTYLLRRGSIWFLNVTIPRPLRHLYLSASGRPLTHIRESLGTSSLKDANRRKLAPLGRYMAEFKRKAAMAAGSIPPAIREAGKFREALIDAANDPWQQEVVESLAIDRAEEIERTAGYAEAKRFYDLATSPTTLGNEWATYMAEVEHGAAARVKDEHAFRSLLTWLGAEDVPVSAVTPEVARSYAKWLNEEAPNARGGRLSYATKLGRVSPLRTLWADHLVPRELAEGNPWADVRLRGRRKSTDDQTDKKRPYTDTELLALLRGPELAAKGDVRYSRRLLLEVTVLCLYTGVRISELANRLVGDLEPIKGGLTLHIRKGKRDDSIRSIPIVHPTPVGLLVARLGQRDDPTEQLFPEFIPGGPEESLAWYVSKALGRYRDKVGLGTATDTHSTRRTFISRLVAAGLPLTLVQHYVGHRPPGITAGIYATPEAAGLLKVAKAVRYSDEVELEVAALFDAS